MHAIKLKFNVKEYTLLEFKESRLGSTTYDLTPMKM